MAAMVWRLRATRLPSHVPCQEAQQAGVADHGFNGMVCLSVADDGHGVMHRFSKDGDEQGGVDELQA